MKIILPKERPMSWNKMYAGTHWRVRRDEALRVHWLVKSILGLTKIKFTHRVDIHVTAFFNRSPLDSDNIPAKFYIDGLREKILENDDRVYVRHVTTTSEIDTKQPRVEIDIEEINL